MVAITRDVCCRRRERHWESSNDQRLPNLMTMIPTIGSRVRRIEDRSSVLATIIAIELLEDSFVLELAYDEGGTGWWPLDAVVVLDANNGGGS